MRIARVEFEIRIVDNPWGWTFAGLSRWIRHGWGLPLSRWKIEQPPRTCRAVGPVVLVSSASFG